MLTMPDEVLPVVDENDRVIALRSRRDVHAEGLRHRAVHILVFDDEGRLFLQKRSLKKDLNAGLWDSSAAGHVDAGEGYEDCAVREINEELGLAHVGAPEPLFKLMPTPRTGMEFVQVYRLKHSGPFSLAPDEIDDGRWFTQDEIRARVRTDDALLTETFKTLWRRFDGNMKG